MYPVCDHAVMTTVAQQLNASQTWETSVYMGKCTAGRSANLRGTSEASSVLLTCKVDASFRRDTLNATAGIGWHSNRCALPSRETTTLGAFISYTIKFGTGANSKRRKRTCNMVGWRKSRSSLGCNSELHDTTELNLCSLWITYA